MTYSIVARDLAAGSVGVAVQTCMFAVGTLAPWARAGVGAVAIQGSGDPGHGPRCLDAMEAGASAEAALAGAQEADSAASLLQVGVVSCDGSAAAMTGEGCIDYAGHVVGEGFSVQANMMASPDVWPAMAEAYRTSSASFPRRLLAALDGGQAAGGDARGMLSAALIVVDAERRDVRTTPLVDLRVDCSDDPLRELRRLLDTSEAFQRFYAAYIALASDDTEIALREIEAALAVLPDEGNMRFLRARALLARGDMDRGRAELRSLIASRRSWEIILRSFAAKGRLAMPGSLSIDAVLD